MWFCIEGAGQQIIVILGDVPNCCEWLTICSDVLFIKEAESVTVFPAAVLAIIMLYCQGGKIKIKKEKKQGFCYGIRMMLE